MPSLVAVAVLMTLRDLTFVIVTRSLVVVTLCCAAFAAAHSTLQAPLEPVGADACETGAFGCPDSTSSEALLLQLHVDVNESRALTHQRLQKKVKVQVFYETRCPFSIDFLINTLQPLWEDTELRGNIDLEMYPAGNVEAYGAKDLSSGYRFWHTDEAAFPHLFRCQHGEMECLGNLIHACAIKQLKEPSVYLPFIFCMAGQPEYSPEKSSYECAQKHGVDLIKIKECAGSVEANEHMFEIMRQSNSLVPPRSYVPWIVVADEHAELAEERDLVAPLCAALRAPPEVGTEPAACAKELPAAEDEILGADRVQTKEAAQMCGPRRSMARGARTSI